MKDWAIQHPNLVAFAFAMWATWVALEIFEAGREIGAATALLGDAQAAVSESLGG